MSVRLTSSQPFNLDHTLCCGQAFRWEKSNGWWYGVVRDRVFKIRQDDDQISFDGVDASFVREYFGLNDDLPEIFAEIGKDKLVRRAIEAFRGLRILRQDPWECLISYICATYKNIAGIKRMLAGLSMRFGERIRFDGGEFYAFPSPDALSKTSESDLTKCGLGYRARYVRTTAKIVEKGGIWLEHLKEKSYEEARTELMNLPGIGPKVADCVSLFSLNKLEAFPVDTWMRRVLTRHYSYLFPKEFMARIQSKEPLTKSEYARLNRFGREYFGDYAGYAQEYLYHHERTHQC